jgi:methionyl-tRNA synthetase
MLMALNLPLPETIFAHGWWTVDGEKMSKSRGNVVDPNKIVESYGVDAFRYFLLREVPFGQDGDFSQAAMITRVNSDLANGIGNLVSRTITMVNKFAEGKIPERGEVSYEETELLIRVEIEGKAQKIMHQHLRFNDDLAGLWWIIQLCDLLIDKSQPWQLVKRDDCKVRLANVLNTLARSIYALSIYLYPYMPKAATEIQKQLGISPDWSIPLDEKSIWDDRVSGRTVKIGNPLFPRIESKPGVKPVSEPSIPSQPTAVAPIPTGTPLPTPPAAASAASPQITIDEFMKIQLKTAKVLSAERVPKSEKLIKLHVSLGAEQRQIVAGIGKKYEPDALVGKTIVVVANLKPAKLMGIESQGMVLAAGDADVRGLLTIQEEVDPGTKVK